MKCAACRHENREGAKFCLGCGKPLARACANCRAELPRSYTPNHLAEKILTSRSAVEGERMQGDGAVL